MISELEQLQTFINQNEIPTVKQQFGFLEIIKKSHNETINSNIYAHFLSCKINDIQHAFLHALISIIKKKQIKILPITNNALKNVQFINSKTGHFIYICVKHNA